ncbi:hypothetical protein WN51_06000 [Melipona quadrifasciata]|uniref:Uncharacterized protein n=1 Tax=Melipona quadrifasciata TaxID=166423 RepID=A0A0N0BD25_9HYME|nr:hypothetical protein WN51_06000 [Melipona quadrifasciata]
MGDDKPSHFLQRMRSMVDKEVPDTILKTIFLEQIPQFLHDILVVNSEADLSKLAILADRVMEFCLPQISNLERSNMTISASHSRADDGYNETKMADTHQLRDDMAAIQYQLVEMTYKMATMETNLSRQRLLHRQPRFRDRRSQSRGRRSQSRGRRSQSHGRRSQSRGRRSQSRGRRSQSRGRPSPSQYKTTRGLCYYHFNFGARARKCKNPCNWSSITAKVAQQSLQTLRCYPRTAVTM